MNKELKKELKDSMEKKHTIASARKEFLKLMKNFDSDKAEIYVRCYTCSDSLGMTTELLSTDLMIEIYQKGEYNEWESLVIASIETEQENDFIEFWEFKETCESIFKTMKKNMVKELESYCYKIKSTEDYNL